LTGFHDRRRDALAADGRTALRRAAEAAWGDFSRDIAHAASFVRITSQ